MERMALFRSPELVLLFGVTLGQVTLVLSLLNRRYLRKLDQELHKFQLELEADNRGITEVLEAHFNQFQSKSNLRFWRSAPLSWTLPPLGLQCT